MWTCDVDWPRLVKLALAGFRVVYLRCVGFGFPDLSSTRLGPACLGLGLGPDWLGWPGWSLTGLGSTMPGSLGLTLRESEFVVLGPTCPGSVELGSLLYIMGLGHRAESKGKWDRVQSLSFRFLGNCLTASG